MCPDSPPGVNPPAPRLLLVLILAAGTLSLVLGVAGVC